MRILAVLVMACGAHALYQTGKYSPSGADVGPPRYITQNQTWQFDITIVAAPKAIVVPLFNDSRKPLFDKERCTGLVSLCCLYQILQSNLYNAELDAFLAYLGPCPSYEGMASDLVLDDAPQPTALATHTTNSFRAWCVSNSQCTLETTATTLRVIAKDMGPNTLLPDTTDRQLNVTFAFVTPTTTPLIQLVFSQHTLVFHDEGDVSDITRHTRHHAFTNVCSDKSKPAHAMWRADLLALNDTCVWFCKPGYILYPSSTDYYYLTTQEGSDQKCWEEPPDVTIFKLHLTVLIPELSAHALYNEYIAHAIIRLQNTTTAAVGVVPQHSIFYLQLVSNVLRQVTWTTWVPMHSLEVSVAIFMPQCDKDISNQTALIKDTIENQTTENTFIEALHTDVPSIDPLLAVIAVQSIEGDNTCKDSLSKRIPFLYIIFLVVWASLICVLCFFCWKAIFERAAGYRRHRFMKYMSPLVRHGFTV